MNHPSADVVVIGAGIVGAACAYELCRRGLAVHLVERYHPAAGTSGACEGLILLWDKAPGPELELGQRSVALWAELATMLARDFEYERTGCLVVAEDEAGLVSVKDLVDRLRQAGSAAELLGRPALRKLEPHLAPDLAGGALFPDDAQVEPRRATLALIEAAERQGLVVHTGTEVTGIKRSGGRVTGLETTAGRMNARCVVSAAGVWSPQIGAMAGIEIPVQPRKGHVIVVERAPRLLRRPILEGGYFATVYGQAVEVEVALVAEVTHSGTMLLGSSRAFRGFDRRVEPEVVRTIVTRALRFLPELARRQAIRVYTGLRPYSPDHLPLIGPAPGIDGFYVATGHEGAGICLAPITGRLIAQVVTGEPPDVAPEPFDPRRLGADGG